MDNSEALRRLQETELEILLVIDDFCKSNNIEWFMDSGTALGAVRHGGFIPWDDDIDIGMMRADYDKFVSLAQEGLPEGYSLQTFANNEAFAGLFAKVYKEGTEFRTRETVEAGCKQGIFVDVFPYDVLALDSRERAKQIKTARTWQYISYLYHAKTMVVPHEGVYGALERFGCRVVHYIVRAFVKRPSIGEHYDASATFNGPASDECMNVSWSAMSPCKISDMVPTSQVRFCGNDLPSPRNPEKYLDNMYGDWRRIPAPENRRTHLPEFLGFGDGTYWYASNGEPR